MALQFTGGNINYKICSACGTKVLLGGNEIFPVSPTKEDDPEETE